MKLSTALCTLALGLGLSGCQSLLAPLGLAKAPRASAVVPTDLANEYFKTRYQQGRLALYEGNYARAIAAFRQSSAMPELKAGSLNGLAVAYARLDRPDLAQRYFSEAIAADPADPRYIANLARLESSMPRQMPGGTPRELLALSGPVTLVPDIAAVPDMAPRLASGTELDAGKPAPLGREIAPGVRLEPQPGPVRLANGAIRIMLPQPLQERLSDGQILIHTSPERSDLRARQARVTHISYPLRISLNSPESSR